MEPKWLKYLRETRPDLYEEYLSACKWEKEWTDKERDTLKETLKNRTTLHLAACTRIGRLESLIEAAADSDEPGCYELICNFDATHLRSRPAKPN